MPIRKVSFENPHFTGTEAAKMPEGTTAQRANAVAGDQRFNSTLSLMEYYDGTNWKTVDTPPLITSVDVTEVATLSGGSQTFVISGSLFATGASAIFTASDGTTLTPDTTTVNNSSQITVTKSRSSFDNAKEPYAIKVTNPSGLSNTLNNAIYVDNDPSWTTSSGNLGTIFSNDTGNHFTVVASDPDGDTISYSETSGTVLSNQNLTLNSSTGVISGDPTDVGSDTNLDFSVRATANGKTSDRPFQITLRPPRTTNVLDFFSDGSAIALYQFETGAVGTDESGNYNATVGNVTHSGSGGKYGGYVTFPAGTNVGSGMTVAGDGLANQFKVSGNWTFSCWFAGDFSSAYWTVNSSQTWWYWNPRYQGADRVWLAHYNTGSSRNVTLDANYTPSGNTWQHFCITNSGSGQCVAYIDGVQVGSVSSSTSTANYTSGGYRIDIAPEEGGSNTGGGSVDQLRMFNRQLSSSEVAQLYNEIG